MTPALRDHYLSLTATQRARLASESRKAFRLAWPHRHRNLRAATVVRCNVARLRDLASL